MLPLEKVYGSIDFYFLTHTGSGLLRLLLSLQIVSGILRGRCYIYKAC